MATRRLARQAARALLFAGGVGTGTVCGQAALLAATYESPEDARGPLHGRVDRALAAERELLRSAWATGVRSVDAGLHAWEAALHEAGDRLREAAAAAAGSSGRDAAAEAPQQQRPVRVLFVGDSIVTGVGCVANEGPMIARRFAHALSDALGASVTWRAHGLTGADVAALRAKVLPSLKQQLASEPERPDAVVLCCGVNDWKRIALGRTASSFGAQLAELVEELRRECGEECVIILPALPMAAATLFPAPLRYVAIAVADAWDAQKAALSGLAHRVLFVAPPREIPGDRAALLSADGVHPNDAGYALWGEHLAAAVAPQLAELLLKRPRDVLPQLRPPALA